MKKEGKKIGIKVVQLSRRAEHFEKLLNMQLKARDIRPVETDSPVNCENPTGQGCTWEMAKQLDQMTSLL